MRNCIFFILIMLCVSCRTVSDVTRTASVNDTVRAQVVARTAVRSDTVYLTRTADRYVYINGDSIFIRDSICVDRWHAVAVHDTLRLADTLRILQVDTVYSQRTLQPTYNARAARNGAIGGLCIAVLFIGTIVYLFFKHPL